MCIRDRFYQDNGPSHAPIFCDSKSQRIECRIATSPTIHALLSPKLYLTFSSPKKCLSGKRFTDENQVTDALNVHIVYLKKSRLSIWQNHLRTLWKKCIDINRDHVKK